MELRQDDIAEIVKIFNDSELVELRLDLGGNRLYLSKQAGGIARWEDAPATGSRAVPRLRHPRRHLLPLLLAPEAPAAATLAPAASTAASAEGLIELKSPLLGVFYRRPSPDKPPFVELGSEVGADDPVCIIDVMKMFSRVPAGAAGRIVEILAEDGQLVEHGQVLMRLEPR